MMTMLVCEFKPIQDGPHNGSERIRDARCAGDWIWRNGEWRFKSDQQSLRPESEMPCRREQRA